MQNNPAAYTSDVYKPNKVAIIGGGIASLILADYLSKKSPNLEITLLCKDSDIASQGSSNKQGAIYPLLQAGKSIISTFYAQAFEHAIKYYRDTLPSASVVPHQWCGVLQQAFNPTMPEKFKEISQLWAHITEYIDDKSSSELAGISTPYSSLYFKDGGWINPNQFCKWLLNDLISNRKVSILQNTEVNSISKSHLGDSWEVFSDGVKTVADHVVICAGIDSPLVTYASINSIPIDGVLGQVSSFNKESSTQPLKTVLCHKGYITPSDGKYQAFGATFEKNYESITSTQEAMSQNIAQIKKVFPFEDWAQQVSNELVNHNNAAVRATTPDHIPIAGELFDWSWIKHHVDNNNGKYKRADKIQGKLDNPLQGLYCLTGLGARGLTSAPILADMVSDLIVNSGRVSKPLNNLIETTAPMRFQLREYKRTKVLPKVN